MAAFEEESGFETGQSRRALMGLAALGAAFGAFATASAQSDRSGDDLSEAALRLRLLRRCSYGATTTDVTTIRNMGYDAWLDWQLDYLSIEDSACENAVNYYSTVNFSERDIFKVITDVAEHELAAATIIRAIKSKRQLYQRMVEFWTDHFNVSFEKAGVLKVIHDREVIRKYALGNFKDMMMANTKSPATIVFLDNENSTKYSPNQNLAREMMELHSVGVNGGYKQADVISVSKCLTGWTVIQWPPDDPDIGKFYFDKPNHAGSAKVVFGKTIPAGNTTSDGERVVKMLTGKATCGPFIARKMCAFFLGYPPSDQLVAQVAQIYTDTGGEIKPMIRAVLAQENMKIAPLMIKRPFHYSMGLLRQTSAQITSYYGIRDVLYTLGQHPFNWAPPNGYPFASTYWVGGLLTRWNYGQWLFQNQIDSIKVDRPTLLKGAATVESLVNRINDVLFAGEIGNASKDLLRPVLVNDTQASGKAITAFTYAVMLPGYQKC